MIPFLTRFWPYIAIAAAMLVLWLIHEHDKSRYAALDLSFANYRTQSAEAAVQAQEAARAALEAQIEQTHKVTLNNQATLEDLQHETAAIAADRDHSRELVRRLLTATARPAPGRSELPQGGDRSSVAPAGVRGSDGGLGELLVNASAECRGNAAQLNSLIAEIKPQL